MTERYEDFAGKKVVVTIDGEEHEGTCEAGSAIGIVFKPKGTSQTKLFEAKDIENISLVQAVRKLKARTLPRVAEGKFRDHLIDRHGYKISDVENMTEEQAREFHEGLDHTDLGHKHRELSPVEQAIEEASADEPDADD